MSTDTTTPDTDRAASMAMMMLRGEVDNGTKAAARFAEAATADPVHAVQWASSDIRAVIAGRLAADVLRGIGDDHSPERVRDVLGGAVDHARKALLERWDNPTSSSMFSNAVSIEEGDAKAQFVGRFTHHVTALTEALS